MLLNRWSTGKGVWKDRRVTCKMVSTSWMESGLIISLITGEEDGEEEKGEEEKGDDDDDDDAEWYKQEVGEEPDPGKCPPCS